MTEPTPKPRDPMRVAIAILGVAVLVMAAIVAFLIWGRSTPTVVPAPTPSSPLVNSTPTTTTTTASPATPIAAATTTTELATTTEAPSTPSPASSSATATGETTSPMQTTSPTQTSSPAQTMMWEGTATFEHFTVEVLRDDANQGAEAIEGKAGLLVEVCVTQALDGGGTARISSDPWTLEDSEGTVQRPQAGGYQPAFPTGGEFAVGECAHGYLTFDYLPAGGDQANLVYENGLGDRAVWQFH